MLNLFRCRNSSQLVVGFKFLGNTSLSNERRNSVSYRAERGWRIPILIKPQENHPLTLCLKMKRTAVRECADNEFISAIHILLFFDLI